jgi:hypothetical protein
MPNYTLTYSEAAGGWVSFYSYYPDWMIGMNNYLYTFKGGDLYRHNTSQTRNTFYSQWWIKLGQPNGAFSPSKLTAVFNQSVLDNKLFKTINLEGDSIWDVQLETDLQNSGFIQSSWFEKKEAAYFAFVRNNASGELALRSLNGIGSSFTVTGAGTNTARINFSISPVLISIGNIISVGDYVYFLSGSTPVLAGPVTAINVDYPTGLNQLVINNNMLTPLTTPIPTNTNYFLYIKNSVAESHGVLGHYCTFNIQNYSNSKIELFAIQSEVMKSFP